MSAIHASLFGAAYAVESRSQIAHTNVNPRMLIHISTRRHIQSNRLSRHEKHKKPKKVSDWHEGRAQSLPLTTHRITSVCATRGRNSYCACARGYDTAVLQRRRGGGRGRSMIQPNSRKCCVVARYSAGERSLCDTTTQRTFANL